VRACFVAHNHPSGTTQASPEDIEVTCALVQAGKLLQIELLDHLIIGQGIWMSMRERRVLLCFDTFEQMAPEAVPWLLDYFLDAHISSNIVLVIARRRSTWSARVSRMPFSSLRIHPVIFSISFGNLG